MTEEIAGDARAQLCKLLQSFDQAEAGIRTVADAVAHMTVGETNTRTWSMLLAECDAVWSQLARLMYVTQHKFAEWSKTDPDLLDTQENSTPLLDILPLLAQMLDMVAVGPSPKLLIVRQELARLRERPIDSLTIIHPDLLEVLRAHTGRATEGEDGG